MTVTPWVGAGDVAVADGLLPSWLADPVQASAAQFTASTAPCWASPHALSFQPNITLLSVLAAVAGVPWPALVLTGINLLPGDEVTLLSVPALTAALSQQPPSLSAAHEHTLCTTLSPVLSAVVTNVTPDATPGTVRALVPATGAVGPFSTAAVCYLPRGGPQAFLFRTVVVQSPHPPGFSLGLGGALGIASGGVSCAVCVTCTYLSRRQWRAMLYRAKTVRHVFPAP